MPERDIHPSPAELHAYGIGQLSPEESDVIEQHISKCEPCCETIADLSSSDTFVELLKEAEQLSVSQPSDDVADEIESSSQTQGIPIPLKEHPRYELIGLIGRGGMGNVYEARHRKMERTVALKVLSREFLRKTEAVDRFHREVKTAAHLSHPNIVTAHDADNAGDYHFMVMEYVDGVDLSRVIRDRGALPVCEACNYIHQAAIGLQYAHEQGMVHRDIKPHNLMLTENGTVKILDFGLASLTPEAASSGQSSSIQSEWTVAGAIMGTPDFISPEQAEDARQADVRSDIYSLGATFYHLLAGRPPFDDRSVMNKLKSHAKAEPERLDHLCDEVPVELADIVARMMAKHPDDRFQTAAEVATAMGPFLDTTQTLQQRPLTKVKPNQQRHRLLTPAVATLLVAAIVAGVVFYLQTGKGTIRVALMDESLEAVIQDETIEIADGEKELEISAGRQQLVIRQKGSDIEFVTDQFRIWRNDEIKLEVSLIAGEVVVSKDGERFDSKKAEWWPPSIGEAPSKESGPWSLSGLLNDDQKYVVGTGEVVAFTPPRQQQSVKASVAGTIRQISETLIVGGHVERGEILVEISPEASALATQLTAQLMDAEARRKSATMQSETARKNIKMREAAKTEILKAAEDSVRAAKLAWDERKRHLAAQKAIELLARSNYEQRKEREGQVYEKDDLLKWKKDWDKAAAELKAGTVAESEAKERWEAEESERIAKEKEADAQIDRAQTLRLAAMKQMVTIQKEIQDIKAKLYEQQRRTIAAPRDGTLSRVNISEPGQTFKVGEELFSITVDPSESDALQRAVELSVSGNDMPNVQQGDRVLLQFEGWPAVTSDGWPSEAVGAYRGRVTSIDPTDGGNGQFRVLVEEASDVAWPNERYLRPGVRAKCWIVIERSRADGSLVE
ncbi:MAG: protein kinase [Planctomycetota bacterium]